MKVLKISAVLLALATLGLGVSAKLIDNDKYFEIIKNIEIFSNVYKELNQNYVEDIDPGELMRTGIDAMVASLDPFTNYISESQVERYRINTQGRYEGIGILVGMIDGDVTITEVTEGGPANAAGIKAADVIKSINGISVVGKSDDEVNQIMRGAPGTDIELSIARPGTSKQQTIMVSRDEVNIPNVPVAEILDNDVAYVSLTTFTADAGKNIRNALEKLKKEQSDLKGIILDLRDNGGGLLREAIAVSNIFIPHGKNIVSTKGKVRERDQSYDTRIEPFDVETPVTVLIDKKSASASEIVSGVIQDYDRGVLIGQRSYGKGLVQNTHEVGYNSRVKLTISKYYIPSGRCIQSVEYKNGEPVDIPDEKRSKFKTSNGRTVLDGGGVSPDVKMEKKELSPFVKSLLNEHVIFKYVTEFVLANPSIDSASTFQFNQYDDFVAFAQKEGFNFQSSSDQLIEQLSKELDAIELMDENKSQIATIKASLSKDQSDDFDEFKEEIIDLIEKDIITRYYFQRGKILNRLNGDPEVTEAIAIMKDSKRYNSILNIK